MPVDQAKLKAIAGRTERVLSRADSEIGSVRAGMKRYAQCVSGNARLLEQIAAHGKARTNLTQFSGRAVKLAEAYGANAANLRDEAEISGDLMEVNARLSALYLVVAVGKIFDAIASATGVGKVVTTAKNSFLDMTDAMRKDDVVRAGAYATNLTLIGVGGEVSEIAKDFDDLQKTLDAVLGIIK